MTLHLPDTSNQDNRPLSHRHPLEQNMLAGCYAAGVSLCEERMRIGKRESYCRKIKKLGDECYVEINFQQPKYLWRKNCDVNYSETNCIKM